MRNNFVFIGIIVLFAMIGCGEDTQNSQTPEFVSHTWEIVSINGEAFEKTFDNNRKDSEFEQEFTVTGNSVVFSDTGTLTIDLGFRTVEKYAGDPQTSMTALISYTTRGSYTTQENMLTITAQNVAAKVDVSLEPEAALKQQIEGITLEQLESDLATETKKGLEQETPPLFKDGTEYTWQVEASKLTISSLQQIIVLRRPN